jgi:cell shape-determining protein MreD
VRIAVCFFDILPEVVALTTAHHLDLNPELLALVLGFWSIHTLKNWPSFMRRMNRNMPTIGMPWSG